MAKAKVSYESEEAAERAAVFDKATVQRLQERFAPDPIPLSAVEERLATPLERIRQRRREQESQ